MGRIIIVGTGALGSLFAARLAQAGHTVTMLGTWREGIDSIRRNGLRLLDAHGVEHLFKIHATDNTSECTAVKYALVLVKAWQTERAAHQLMDCLAGDGIAVTLQNGLGNRDALVQRLGLDRVALGVTTTGATLLGPGVVQSGGDGTISIERSHALGPLEALLSSAGLDVQMVDDALSLIWGKLVISSAINPVTALLRIPNGELLQRPPARQMMGALARETAQVAAAEKILLPFQDPVAAAEEVARKTAVNRSSMLQDVLRGTKTEIDAICGGIVRAGQKHRIETPMNWSCWNLVRALSE